MMFQKQEIKASLVDNPMFGYKSLDYKSNEVRGVIGLDGDFISIAPKPAQFITSVQRKIINFAGGFLNEGQIPATPNFRLGGSRAQDAFGMVSDMRGGQKPIGKVTW